MLATVLATAWKTSWQPQETDWKTVLHYLDKGNVYNGFSDRGTCLLAARGSTARQQEQAHQVRVSGRGCREHPQDFLCVFKTRTTDVMVVTPTEQGRYVEYSAKNQ
jgi:hypothetical protein